MTTGIAGIFFKAEDPKKLTKWYADNLGINGNFRWRSKGNNQARDTQWNALDPSSSVFTHTQKQYVISYYVDDLRPMLDAMKDQGTVISDKIEKSERGETGFAIDPDGNKVILVQPVENVSDMINVKSDRVTGLGGVFFRSDDARKLNEWYGKHLGIAVTEWGSSFEWIDTNDPDAKVPAVTSWSIFKSDTKYLDPSKKEFMLNYRVKDLPALLKILTSNGVTLAGEMQEYPYGKFGWILDPENNKIELWEPKDEGFAG